MVMMGHQKHVYWIPLDVIPYISNKKKVFSQTSSKLLECMIDTELLYLVIAF